MGGSHEQDGTPWSRLTALVLGGSGMIGRHVIESLLRRGASVQVLTRPNSPNRARNLAGLPVRLVEGDLEEPLSIRSALDGIDVLFHCAAPYPRSHFHKERQVRRAVASLQSLLETARSRVPSDLQVPPARQSRLEVEQAAGAAWVLRHQPEREAEMKEHLRSLELLEQARAGRLNASLHPPLREVAHLPGLKRIVYVSSVTTIGRPRGRPHERPEANEADREDRVRGSSPYFVMKEEMEAAVTRAALQGMPIVIGNPTFCVDTHDATPTSGKLLLAVARRQMPVYLPGTMNAVATRDVAEALVNAASWGRTAQRYILGDENLTAREFLRRVANVAGVPPPRWPLPLAVAEALAWSTEVVNLLLRRTWPLLPISGVQMMRYSQPVDPGLARAELAMPRTPLDVAIRDALEWLGHSLGQAKQK
jgi:nucleoside-diphosphate-sugar epimerase